MNLKELKNIIDKIYNDVYEDVEKSGDVNTVDIEIGIINQRSDIVKIKNISLKKSYIRNEITLEIQVINL